MISKKSAQFMRKRKFYLALPMLVLPFITLAFWSMGGGKTTNETIDKPSTGLNLQLPDAQLKNDQSSDKLSFYSEADKDSIKHQEELRNDPYYHDDTSINALQIISQSNAASSRYLTEGRNNNYSLYNNEGIDANEKKVYKKIDELKRQINHTDDSQSVTQNSLESSNNNSSNEQFSKQIDKLQNMMQVMNDKQENDPEMEQLNTMLNKIMDIQHPERIKDSIKEKSIRNKQEVFPVEIFDKNNNISLIQSDRTPDTMIKKQSSHNAFYDLNNNSGNEVSSGHAIEAVIHETQTVVSGSTVKLRITNDIYIDGILIRKNNFIYGTASLENDRLGIHVNSVRYENNLLPVALEVYDLDGLPGIYIPGSVSRDVAKSSAEQGLQNVELSTINPSIAAQATSAGIQATKSLLTKKVKLVKVTLQAGYKVLLKDNNKNNN